MTMKRTELEKRMGLTIVNAQRRAENRYAPAQAAPVDRKAVRAAERAAGLVPFAVKLPAELVTQVHARAQRDGVAVNEAVASLLRAGLDTAGPPA